MIDLLIKYIGVPLAIFIGGYIFLRISGKKAVSEMNSFDLLLIIVVGTVIAEPLVTKNTNEALYYAFVFIIIYMIFSKLILNNKLRWILIEKPTVLLKDGDIYEKGLRKIRMTTDELLAELRIKGHTNPKDIESVIMESMGKLSIIPKSYARSLQANDIQLHPSPTFIPIPVIMNGQIIDQTLAFLKKDMNWLEMQLKANQRDLDTISDITLATYNQQGILDIDTDQDDPTSEDQRPY